MRANPQQVEDQHPFARLAGLGGLAFIVFELLLLLLVMQGVDMLPITFRRIIYLAVAGFVINHLLPLRFRQPFFSLISALAFVFVLGSTTSSEQPWSPGLALPRAGLIFAVGLVVIAVCRLQISFWYRAAMLVAAGVTAALFRSGYLATGGLDVVWIIVPALFMFRAMVYLYDTSTSAVRPTYSQSIAYFFPFPSVCFTLFPVIDFKTLRRSHYNAAALDIYQRGVRWMVRGVVQMLIYRYVEQVFAKDASSVSSGADLLRYLVSNVLFYLDVSGHFHFIIGLLLLFGFNLPATNRNYFLASSFTDYWRRINIYWKDFIMKLFYYPAYHSLKGFGMGFALTIATAWVFAVTWALHLYQTWWLQGSVSLSAPDGLFWFILGLLVLANSLWELKRGRPRAFAERRHSVGSAVRLMLQTAGTFSCICMLWSIWSSPSLSEWAGLWAYTDRTTIVGSVAILLMVALAKLTIDILPGWIRRPKTVNPPSPRGIPWLRESYRCVAPMVAIYIIAHLATQSRLPDFHPDRIDSRISAQRLYDVLEAGDSLISNRHNEELNYYKRLTGLNEGNRQLLEIMLGRPLPRFPHDGNPPVVATQDLRSEELLPDAHATGVYECSDFRTNRWGMRDRDYTIEKPLGVTRIALMGSSHVLGYAVRLEEDFETLLEERLNREFTPDAVPHYEILNFAQSGYSPLGQVEVLRKRVLQFHPDIIILVGHTRDLGAANYRLRENLRRNIPIPYGFLQEVLQSARVTAHTHSGLAEKRLKPFESSLVEWSLQQIMDDCRSIGAQAVYVAFPAPGTELPKTPDIAAKGELLEKLAAKAGFVVFDEMSLFDGYDSREVSTGIVPHSNAKAHRLIADELFRRLTSDPRIDVRRFLHSTVDRTQVPGSRGS